MPPYAGVLILTLRTLNTYLHLQATKQRRTWIETHKYHPSAALEFSTKLTRRRIISVRTETHREHSGIWRWVAYVMKGVEE